MKKNQQFVLPPPKLLRRHQKVPPLKIVRRGLQRKVVRVWRQPALPAPTPRVLKPQRRKPVAQDGKVCRKLIFAENTHSGIRRRLVAQVQQHVVWAQVVKRLLLSVGRAAPFYQMQADRQPHLRLLVALLSPLQQLQQGQLILRAARAVSVVYVPHQPARRAPVVRLLTQLFAKKSVVKRIPELQRQKLRQTFRPPPPRPVPKRVAAHAQLFPPPPVHMRVVKVVVD